MDLLVAKHCTAMSAHLTAEILIEVEPEFPVDLIVCSSDKVEKRLAMKDLILEAICRRRKGTMPLPAGRTGPEGIGC